jgi:membrane-bound ClpP family serine protease
MANETNNERKNFAVGKENLKSILIDFIIVVIGFVLMSGGGSSDPNVFDESIFSFRRITLAPIVVLAGFGFVIYAIMKKPKEE